MFVSATINGQVVHALLDTGATYNFISKDETKHLGLEVTKEGGTMKVVNSPAKRIASTTQSVRVTLVTWSRKLDFFVVPMDDFKMIRVMKFFD